VEFGIMRDDTVAHDLAVPAGLLTEVVDAVVEAMVASIPNASLLPESEMRRIARHGAEVTAALPPARRPLGIAAAARQELVDELLLLNGIVVPPAM
jgi:hypothetical protein